MIDNYRHSGRVKINVSHSLVFDYMNATKLRPNFEFMNLGKQMVL